ncbi:MAG: tetratricopeptide repeat protein [Methylophilaceae bacterium]
MFRYAWMILLALVLTSCGYNDNLHVRHGMLKLLWQEHYAELDDALNQQYQLYRAGKLKGRDFSDQIWTLQMADPLFAPRFEKYTESKPESRWAYLVQGFFLLQQASNARGDDVGARTSADKFSRMTDLAMNARYAFKQAEKNSAPESFTAAGLIKINMLLGVRAGNADLVSDGMMADPTIWRAAIAYFNTLYPQWGGTEAEMLAFIQRVKPGNPKLAEYLDADFYWRRGLDLELAGRTDEAIATYNQSIKIYPHADALKNVGGIYLRQGQCELAEEVLKKNLKENDEWDLWTLETLHQAQVCAGSSWQARRTLSKRDELIYRYHDGN